MSNADMFRRPCPDGAHGEPGMPSDRWKRPRCSECGYDMHDADLATWGVKVHDSGTEGVEWFEWPT